MREGELPPAQFFAERLGISSWQLVRLEGIGGVFSIDFDGAPVYQALLASSRYDQRRLRRICRTIFSALPAARLDFLL